MENCIDMEDIIFKNTGYFLNTGGKSYYNHL